MVLCWHKYNIIYKLALILSVLSIIRLNLFSYFKSQAT